MSSGRVRIFGHGRTDERSLDATPRGRETWPPAQSPRPWFRATVQKGTLFEIGLMFGTAFEELARINGIANPNLIFVGQVIRLE